MAAFEQGMRYRLTLPFTLLASALALRAITPRRTGTRRRYRVPLTTASAVTLKAATIAVISGMLAVF